MRKTCRDGCGRSESGAMTDCKRRQQQQQADESRPRRGDAILTLETDAEKPLEERQDLLAYAFAKALQGATLRRIVEWNLAGGRVEVIIGGGPAIPGPRGAVRVEVDDYVPGVCVKARPCEPDQLEAA